MKVEMPGCCGCLTLIIFFIGLWTVLGWIF